MKETINKIISIEEKAQGIKASAVEEKDYIENHMESEIRALEEEILFKQERKLKQLRESELKEAQEIANEHRKDSKVEIENLQKVSQQQMEHWCQVIFDKIIER